MLGCVLSIHKGINFQYLNQAARGGCLQFVVVTRRGCMDGGNKKRLYDECIGTLLYSTGGGDRFRSKTERRQENGIDRVTQAR
jgi:hypothetical protein